MSIKINEVCFKYHKNNILQNLSCTLPSGELITVLGANGAGKSTLIKCLNGLNIPQKGEIYIDNVKISEMNIKDISRKISYVPQSFNTVFSLQVLDMVLLGRCPHYRWKDSLKDIELAYGALKLLNIEQLALENFDTLSGGQQQKVIIARAIAQETDIILLDEAISNLDIKHQLDVMEIVQRLVKEKNITVVMIVHDLNIAGRYSDKIMIMDNGNIFKYGTPEDVLTRETINTVYGVEVEINQVRNKINIVPLKVATI